MSYSWAKYMNAPHYYTPAVPTELYCQNAVQIHAFYFVHVCIFICSVTDLAIVEQS